MILTMRAVRLAVIWETCTQPFWQEVECVRHTLLWERTSGDIHCSRTSQLPRLTPFIWARPDLTAARAEAAELAARAGAGWVKVRKNSRTAPHAADAAADPCMLPAGMSEGLGWADERERGRNPSTRLVVMCAAVPGCANVGFARLECGGSPLDPILDNASHAAFRSRR